MDWGAEWATTGDTKAGRLVGKDLYGNKYYENMEDLPCMASSIHWIAWKLRLMD